MLKNMSVSRKQTNDLLIFKDWKNNSRKGIEFIRL